MVSFMLKLTLFTLIMMMKEKVSTKEMQSYTLKMEKLRKDCI
jgi:hypothetical protein